MTSRPDCIFEIHQQWQSGFSRVYSNCCCSCSFEPEIIKIGQLSYKMYSNNLLNFQESTTILNACTKSLETYWRHHVHTHTHTYIYIYIHIYIYVWIYNPEILCLCNSIKILSSFLISTLVSGFNSWMNLPKLSRTLYPPIPTWNQDTYQETWKDLDKIKLIKWVFI